MLDWTLLIEYLPKLLPGLLTTLQLMLFSLIFGLFLALTLTGLSLTRKRWLTIPIETYIFFIRGTPILVQLFLIYFGLSQFEWLRNSLFWYLFRDPANCAIIAFGLNTAAYTTVLLKGAINGIPKGEIEAGIALGMNQRQIFRRISLPQAFRNVLPAYSNEVLMIMKATSLASTITLLDIIGVTQQIISETYAPIEFFLLAGAIYLLLNTLIIGLFKLLER